MTRRIEWPRPIEADLGELLRDHLASFMHTPVEVLGYPRQANEYDIHIDRLVIEAGRACFTEKTVVLDNFCVPHAISTPL